MLREGENGRGSTVFEPERSRRELAEVQRGFFVSFGYTKDAPFSSRAECAAFHKRTGRIINLLTVQEILDEEHVQKM